MTLASEMPSGPFDRSTGKLYGTAAQKAGVRYERKVQERLSEIFGEAYSPSPWFRFLGRPGRTRRTQRRGAAGASGAWRWCQPDGIVRIGEAGGLVVIFEVKSRFSSDGWYQLRQLYHPVVMAAYRPAVVGLCLISRYYDPFVSFPEDPHLIPNLEQWVVRRDFKRMGVFSWPG